MNLSNIPVTLISGVIFIRLSATMTACAAAIVNIACTQDAIHP